MYIFLNIHLLFALLCSSVDDCSLGVGQTLILHLLDMNNMILILDTDPDSLTEMVKCLVTVVLVTRTLPPTLLTIT